MRATCSAHLIVLHFIIIITFGEDYKLRSFLLCSFIYFPSLVYSFSRPWNRKYWQDDCLLGCCVV